MRSIALPMTLLFALTACDDEGSHDRTRTDAQPMVGQAAEELELDPDDAPAGVVTIVMTEYQIQVDRDSVAPGPVRFRVRNNGAHEHVLELEGNGREWRTDRLQPGQWATLDVELSAGTHELYCPVRDPGGVHADRGMREFIVVADR